METFGKKILSFYQGLSEVPRVPDGVEILSPHLNAEAWDAMTSFYLKYYDDARKRIFLIGINPGRFGAGTTGIPFTDPVRLHDVLSINHNFDLKPELSSRFIYHMIEAYGGAKAFYSNCYFTSVSPFGFTKSGKNLNYYDIKELQDNWEAYMAHSLKKQVTMGACPNAFSLGQGKNYRYLLYLNNKYRLFEEVLPLPHPRWVMQYRLKRLEEFVDLYCNKLREAYCYSE